MATFQTFRFTINGIVKFCDVSFNNALFTPSPSLPSNKQIYLEKLPPYMVVHSSAVP